MLIGRFVRQGFREGDVLRALASYRAFGEWFRDTPELRAAILGLLGDGVKFRDRMPKPKRRLPKGSSVADADAAVAAWLAAQPGDDRADVRAASARNVARILANPRKYRIWPAEEPGRL